MTTAFTLWRAYRGHYPGNGPIGGNLILRLLAVRLSDWLLFYTKFFAIPEETITTVPTARYFGIVGANTVRPNIKTSDSSKTGTSLHKLFVPAEGDLLIRLRCAANPKNE